MVDISVTFEQQTYVYVVGMYYNVDKSINILQEITSSMTSRADF